MSAGGIKDRNLDFWTQNVPGLDDNPREISAEFFRKAMANRYGHESYLEGFFAKVLEPEIVSLEIGCGLGMDLATFSMRGAQATGLDYSPENARLSLLGLRSLNLKGRAISGDGESLPFPDCSFDLVWSWGVLHHTPNTAKAIDEVFRVLRPGGKAVVMLYHKGYQYIYMVLAYLLGLKWLRQPLQDFLSKRYDNAPLSQFFSREELRQIFSKFEQVKIDVVPFGGIKSHPVLRHLWTLFQTFPALQRRLGSFAVTQAVKPGASAKITEVPEICCPKCRTVLPHAHPEDKLRCSNEACGAEFSIYKGLIPVLHD